MKNLLIYVNPSHDWDRENKKLSKLQIDNSLELGWKKEDILLFTNFPYEYNGVKSTQVPDDLFCDYFHQMSKINTICYLFEKGMIGDDVYWFHDMEAFQNYPIPFQLTKDIAITDYGYCPRWNTGSFFFRKSARDIFDLIKKDADTHQDGEEWALGRLTSRGTLNGRYEILDITYNFPGSVNAVRNFRMIYEKAGKPIMVPHFHPDGRRGLFYRVMTGDNELKEVVLTERLIKIFNKYGYK